MAYAIKRREELAAKKIQCALRMKSEKEKFKKMVKQHAYRTQVAKELLATEESYIAKLQIVVDEFMAPLRKAAEQGKPILNDAEIRTIFMTVEVIVKINIELREKLRQRLKEWRPQQLIGDIFIKIADCFKIYTDYVSHFSESSKAVMEATKKPEFAEFCTKTFVRIDDPLANLTSYLVTPIQRIPRYELLLKDLLKHTWPEHADYENLQVAVDVITKTAIHVNEKQKESENIQKVISIQNTLQGKKVENLIDPHRRFVREGQLNEVVKENKVKARWFILFNDVLVKCELPKGSSMKKKDATIKFDYIAKIPLAGGAVVNSGDEGEIRHSFQLVTSRDIIWLSCDKESEKVSWMDSMNACVKALAQKSEAIDKQLTQIAKQKASAAKNLIDEKYTAYRVHGSLNGSLKGDDIMDGVSFHSMSAQERMQMAEKAGEKVKMMLAEEKERNELAKQKAQDFKEQAGQKYKKNSLNGSMDGEEPKLRKFASLKKGSVDATAILQGSGGEEKEGEKDGGSKLREFAKMRRDTLTPSSSEENLNSSGGTSSPEESPRIRRFASLKRESYKSQENAATSGAAGAGGAGGESNGDESPRLRKFAQRRESLRRDSVAEATASDPKGSLKKTDTAKKDKKKEKKEKKEKRGTTGKRGSTAAPTTQNEGAEPGGEPKMRRFASMKRESYKRASTDPSPPNSPGKEAAGAAVAATVATTVPAEAPKMRRFAQKNELYKNLAAKEN